MYFCPERGKKAPLKQTLLSSLLLLSPASLFSPPLTLNPLHFFPPPPRGSLSIHFISLQFFAAISPRIRRLSLILVSPGFLSPTEREREKGGGGSPVRRSPMMHTQTLTWVSAMVTGRSVGIWRNGRLRDVTLRNIPHMEVIPVDVACCWSTCNTCSKCGAQVHSSGLYMYI